MQVLNSTVIVLDNIISYERLQVDGCGARIWVGGLCEVVKIAHRICIPIEDPVFNRNT